MIHVETDLVLPPPNDASFPHHQPVARFLPLSGGRPAEVLYWNNVACERVRVVEGLENTPYQIVTFDFDRLIVDSEGKDRLYSVCWRETFRQAISSVSGLELEAEELDRLHQRVYKWRGNLTYSAEDMVVERIMKGVDIAGDNLGEDAEILNCLLDIEFIDKWARETLGRPIQVGDRISHIIAAKKEKIGIDLLRDNPHKALELAPYMPGVRILLKRLQEAKIPLAVLSAGRKDTIRAILGALSVVDPWPDNFDALGVLGHLIVGEEDVLGYTKPSKGYYWQAWAKLGSILRPRIPISLENSLHIGDGPNADVLRERQSYHLVVGRTDATKEDLGPLTLVVESIPALLRLIDQRESADLDPLIRRLALTINR